MSLCLQYVLDRGRVVDPRLLLVGPVHAPRMFAPPPGFVFEAVQLKPEWSRAVFGPKASDYADEMPAFGDVVGVEAAALEARAVAAVREIGSSLGVLLGYAEQRYADAGRDSEATLASAGLDLALGRCGGHGTSLGQAADAVGVSPRHLRRAVRASTGAGPKYLQRVHRLLRTMAEADGDPAPRWSTLAVSHGYYDQAHFISECRALSELTPVELHRERRAEQVPFFQYAEASTS